LYSRRGKSEEKSIEKKDICTERERERGGEKDNLYCMDKPTYGNPKCRYDMHASAVGLSLDDFFLRRRRRKA
jgi:hypothetical protein